jgi:hypothetical protein
VLLSLLVGVKVVIVSVSVVLRLLVTCGCTIQAEMCGRPSRVTTTRFIVIHLPFVGLVGLVAKKEAYLAILFISNVPW